MEKTIIVEGMMCGHCVMHVEGALKGIPGVTNAKADLKSGTAKVTVTKDVADEAFAAAIAKAGYVFKGVK